MTLSKTRRCFVQTLALLVACSYVYGGEGKCIWYGTCGKNPNGVATGSSPNGQCLNCYRPDKSPSPLPPEARKMLFEACPHFQNKSDDNPKFCCTPQQIEDMHTGFEMAKQLLNKCPTCYLNFRKNFCASTCSPVQSQFLRVSNESIITGKKEPCGKWDKVDPGKFIANSVTA